MNDEQATQTPDLLSSSDTIVLSASENFDDNSEKEFKKNLEHLKYRALQIKETFQKMFEKLKELGINTDIEKNFTAHYQKLMLHDVNTEKTVNEYFDNLKKFCDEFEQYYNKYLREAINSNNLYSRKLMTDYQILTKLFNIENEKKFFATYFINLLHEKLAAIKNKYDPSTELKKEIEPLSNNQSPKSTEAKIAHFTTTKGIFAHQNYLTTIKKYIETLYYCKVESLSYENNILEIELKDPIPADLKHLLSKYKNIDYNQNDSKFSICMTNQGEILDFAEQLEKYAHPIPIITNNSITY